MRAVKIRTSNKSKRMPIIVIVIILLATAIGYYVIKITDLTTAAIYPATYINLKEKSIQYKYNHPDVLAHISALKKNAELGDATAQKELGFQYDYGIWLEQDRTLADKWYRQAAYNGNIDAQRLLADRLNRGIHGWTKNPEEASQLLSMASQCGDERSQHQLGIMYLHGHGGLEVDLPRAYMWLSIGYNKEHELRLLQDKLTLEEIEQGKRLAKELELDCKTVKTDILDLVPVPPLPDHIGMPILSEEECRIGNFDDPTSYLNKVKSLNPFKELEPKIDMFRLLCGGRAQYTPVDQCGRIVGVTSGANDAPYYFVDISSKQVLGYCSFWKSLETQSPCQPPRQWTCGIPENYR